MAKPKGLVERLTAGEDIICAEGYILELEQRGYLQGGSYVPEVVLENSHVLRTLHEEFVHAGSDVVQALMFYLHRSKLKQVKREGDLEKINREALRIARQVADKTGTLMAGSFCNTLQYDPDQPEKHQEIRNMYKEQVEWAVQEGADFFIGETFDIYGEAAIGLECILKCAPGLPAVITLTPQPDGLTYDGVPVPEACRRLEEAGAAVVGLNCWMGPETILPYMQKVRDACKGPVACLPIAYRTTDKYKTYMELRDDEKTGKAVMHQDLNGFHSTRTDIRELTRKLKAMGVQYMGLCCGGQAHYFREMAETVGRRPPASRYSTNMGYSVSGNKEGDIAFTNRSYLRKFGDLSASISKD